jgi:serine/threonine protein kinase
MVIRAQAEIEPIPGYRLIERLGGGGFGEVWKAEAPGGIMKAIKFVHGTLTQGDEESAGVRQELKSLNRVKSVRHPYILSLERYDIVDGQLLIVMELADRNLWDRFKECQGQGLPGIPREELLRYLEEAAEALDLMNIQYQLQHLDIKPQNLFLVHNHIKVADFGLVKDLEGMNTQVTGGVTPVYAAPETFDGVISRYCDQYNLAIVYQEMLTGQRPFNGTNVRQLLMQHLTGTPDLKGLPSCDQEAIRRALSKKPEDRFPTCADMVQALRRASLTVSALNPTRMPASQVGIVTPANLTQSPTVVSTPHPHELNHTTSRPIEHIPRPSMAEPPRTEKRFVPIPERPLMSGEGMLMPSLVIGLGRLGLHVLQALRKNLSERCGPPEITPHIRLLYLETDPETVPEAFDGDPSSVLAENEVLLARLNKPAHYLKPIKNRVSIESWLNLAMLCRIPRNQVTTEGLRLLGRLALADNYRPIITKLKSDLEAIAAPAALASADRATRLGLRSNQPRVYVVTGLGGGTGSGMFIDIAYLVQRQLQRLGVTKPEVVGMLMLPPADRNARKSPALVNTFAALTELNHFSVPGSQFSAFLDDSEEPLKSQGPPFTRTFMLPLPEEGGDGSAVADLLTQAGDFLSRDLVTPLGRAADKIRSEITVEDTEGGMVCQTFGTYRFSVPRRELLERIGRSLCARLVNGWLSQDKLSLQKSVRTRLTEQYAKLELTPDSLIAGLQKACERSLGQSPESVFESIIHKTFNQPGFEPPHAQYTLSQLEQIVGQPREDESAPVTSSMLEALDEAAEALHNEWEERLTDVVHGLLDEPRFRLAGAEEASQQVVAMLGEIERSHQALLQELEARTLDSHSEVRSLLQQVSKGSWWPGRKAKMIEEIRNNLDLFAKTRYQLVVLECLIAICQKLQESLPQRFQDLSFCRQRLGEFLQAWEEPAQEDFDLGPGRHFLPGNVTNVADAVAFLLKSVKPDDIHEIDAKVQAVVRRQFKTLLQACMAPTNALQEVQATIQEQVEAHAEALLGKATVATLYLKQRPADKDICADIAQAFQEANPTLAGPHSNSPEMGIVVVPTEGGGDRLGKLSREVSSEIEVVTASGAPDIFFYREQTHVKLADLPQLSLMAEEAYRQMTSTGHFNPHTRTDVTEWRPAT